MTIKQKKFLKKQEFEILDEIVSEAGVMLISFLLSGRSAKRMYEIRREMESKRAFSRKEL